MATIQIQGLVKEIKPYDPKKERGVMRVTDNSHKIGNDGVSSPVAVEYFVLVKCSLEVWQRYDPIKVATQVAKIAGDFIIAEGKLVIITKPENIYFC